MVDERSKSELRSTWESAAPGWAKWENVFSAGLAEATDALIDMAGVMPGQRVLDVACGAGSQSMLTAKRVGPGGCVVASDISGTMLEHVRQNAKVETAWKILKPSKARQRTWRYRKHPFRCWDLPIGIDVVSGLPIRRWKLSSVS